MTDWRKEYEKWCASPMFDESTRAELKALGSDREIEDRFYKELTFGTGGLRGVLGAGTNRMNIYTVGKATQGLADFINSSSAQGGVVIAYDSRRMSKEFALDSALILAANGIQVYLFDNLRPTPELSFAVRELGAAAGVVITASHNPPQYNGYKVYWSDGGQIVPPYDRLIIERVNAVSDYSQVRRITKEQAIKKGLLKFIGKDIDDRFAEEIKKLVLNPEEIAACADKLKIVYTPLNGTGNVPVKRILCELGFKNVYAVREQEAPDGNFPTLKAPNPEDPSAFSLARSLAQRTGAHLVLATDPDADRLGVMVKHGGDYVAFTGNMTGIIICDYLLSERSKRGLLPANRADGAVVSTIVSSDMIFPLAADYGLTVIRTLTGFKYVGEQMKLFEDALRANGGKPDKDKGAYIFQFGFEESYGCLAGAHARDKDAVSAAAILAEAAAFWYNRGKTLWDRMCELYAKYGRYKESQRSFTMEGADGAQKIAAICEKLRANPPESIGGFKVLKYYDYKAGTALDRASGALSKTLLPKSNVLYFELENSAWCCARPSGTEPKIKLYFGVKGSSEEQAERLLCELSDSFVGYLEK